MTRNANSVIGALFILLSISITVVCAFVYEQRLQNVTQSIKNTQLWVNSFDATRDQWAKKNISPYLNAQDFPDNYVYGETRGVGSNDGDQIGDFGFEDHSQTGTINSVKLRVYGRARPASPNENYFSVYLWDGSTWNQVMDFRGQHSFVWKEVDVSSYLNTWDKINGAKIYLETEAIGENWGRQICDAALLVVDYEI